MPACRSESFRRAGSCFRRFTIRALANAVADGFAAGKILYPQSFADLDPKNKADDIYTFLLGKPVYKQMETEFGEIGRVPRF